jgi:hypothetical protein
MRWVQVLLADGSFAPDVSEDEWEGHAAKTWAQLEWWGNACVEMRARVDPFEHAAANAAMSDRASPGAK